VAGDLYKIAVPDLVSPSYFPAEAAVELGFFEREGVRAQLLLCAPVERAYAALREGEIDFVAGSAHSVLSAFPRWRGAKLLCAQSQGMYWFLVMRADLGIKRGDLEAVKGRRIGAAPWVGMGLRQLLAASGIDLDRDNVVIAPMPGSVGQINFGLAAARALEEGAIDGFWANGMGAEIAVRSGVGSLLLDVRRDGPDEAFDYTMPALAAADRLIAERPEVVEGAIRAIVAVQKALIANPERAAEVGRRLFPAEADLIVDLVRRDLPFYRPQISSRSVEGMNRFARSLGILDEEAAYEDVVATQFSRCWD